MIDVQNSMQQSIIDEDDTSERRKRLQACVCTFSSLALTFGIFIR